MLICSNDMPDVFKYAQNGSFGIFFHKAQKERGGYTFTRKLYLGVFLSRIPEKPKL